jgi:hypothetical protein
MQRMSVLLALATLLVFIAGAGLPAIAQDQSAAPSAAPNEVTAGTRFLIGLEQTLATESAKSGDRFRARTLEPLTSSDGTTLPSGAVVRGHIDKVETAHQAGRARLWLTFDDIKTPDGWVPLVAMVTDVPGVHSIRVDYDREGEIEARTDKRHEEAEAAAAGAFVGAAPGVAAHSGKDAAIGAAVGAATAFMVASGLGQEFTLAKNTKLELILERSLYFGRT